MPDPLPPSIQALALLLFAVSLPVAAMQWRRPRVSGTLQSHATTAAWVLGNALLAAATVSSLRAALGLALGDAAVATPWVLLLRGEVIALAGVGLLVSFAEAETNRGVLLSGAALAAAVSVAVSAPLEALGLRLEPGPLGAALAAAVAAPLLLSAGSRAMLITRVRKAAMTAAGDHILILDSAGRLLYASEEARAMLKLGSTTGGSLPKVLQQLVRDGSARRSRLRTRSGRILEAWVTPSQRRGPLKRGRGILIRDVTGRYQDERRLMKLAHYDSLTGLPNRRLFLETLTNVLKAADRSSSRAGLFYIDLDGFKAINDSLGHGAGDQLLETLAERLRTHLLPEQVARFGLGDPPLTVARLSGDEFAVIAPQIPDDQAATDLARWILELVGRPVELGDRTLNPSASVGIALSPEDGRDLDTLIRRADTALYAAKTKGRGRYLRYKASFEEKTERARSLESGLRHAIEREELRLFYQPKVDARTGAVTGFEALMRWKSAELGDIGPAEFIPVAEDRGLITELGTWSLHRACRQLAEWKEAGFAIAPVAVNVSSHQFNEVDLQSVVSEALKQHRIDPHFLELELTESLLLGQGDHVQLVLRDLRAIGVRIALDDFGTGYSALTYLNRFDLDILKIDRDLLRDIDTNPSAAGIVSAVVSMAHSLGLTVVAEGVDSEDQVPILQEMRCDQIQGFLYAPALPPEDMTRFLARVGEPPPIAKPVTISPGAPRTEPQTGEEDDAPVLRDAPRTEPQTGEEDDAPVLRDAPRKLVATHEDGHGPSRGRVLIVDDGCEALGRVALRLGLLGIDTHYASAADEALLLVAQESDGIRALLAPPSVDLDGLRSVADRMTEVCGERRSVIVIGERPDDLRRTAIREAEVDWVLWAPFNDTEMRCLMKSALSLSSEIADRREPRVPVDLVANIACGARREVAVVSSLSARGAFIETDDPFPIGSNLKIEMDMPFHRFRGFARVIHVQRDNPDRPLDPSGMGVTFFGSDRHTERVLRKAVKELEARYLP